MNKKKYVMGSVIGVSSLFVGMTLAVGKKVYRKTFGAKPRVIAAEMEAYYLNHENRLLEKLEGYSHQKFFVENPKNGYLIETLHIKSKKVSNHVMILVHGITSNYYELLSGAFRYLDDGYNVMLYNQRQTGLTGGKNYTFGLYERLDLDAVIDIACRLYPEGIVGVHGFSMGAATAAMHAELNKKSQKVNLYILDAPYHTMESSVQMALEAKKPFLLPKKYIKWSGNLMLYLKNKVTYKDVQPLQAIAHADVPVLIVHGTADKITSPEGSQMLYDNIKHSNKRLKYFQGSGHCVAYRQQEKEYFKEIYDFIDQYVLI